MDHFARQAAGDALESPRRCDRGRPEEPRRQSSEKDSSNRHIARQTEDDTAINGRLDTQRRHNGFPLRRSQRVLHDHPESSDSDEAISRSIPVYIANDSSQRSQQSQHEVISLVQRIGQERGEEDVQSEQYSSFDDEPFVPQLVIQEQGVNENRDSVDVQCLENHFGSDDAQSASNCEREEDIRAEDDSNDEVLRTGQGQNRGITDIVPEEQRGDDEIDSDANESISLRNEEENTNQEVDLTVRDHLDNIIDVLERTSALGVFSQSGSNEDGDNRSQRRKRRRNPRYRRRRVTVEGSNGQGPGNQPFSFQVRQRVPSLDQIPVECSSTESENQELDGENPSNTRLLRDVQRTFGQNGESSRVGQSIRRNDERNEAMNNTELQRRSIDLCVDSSLSQTNVDGSRAVTEESAIFRYVDPRAVANRAASRVRLYQPFETHQGEGFDAEHDQDGVDDDPAGDLSSGVSVDNDGDPAIILTDENYTEDEEVEYDDPAGGLSDDDPAGELSDDDPAGGLSDDDPVVQLLDDDSEEEEDEDEDPAGHLSGNDPVSRLLGDESEVDDDDDDPAGQLTDEDSLSEGDTVALNVLFGGEEIRPRGVSRNEVARALGTNPDTHREEEPVPEANNPLERLYMRHLMVMQRLHRSWNEGQEARLPLQHHGPSPFPQRTVSHDGRMDNGQTNQISRQQRQSSNADIVPMRRRRITRANLQQSSENRPEVDDYMLRLHMAISARYEEDDIPRESPASSGGSIRNHPSFRDLNVATVEPQSASSVSDNGEGRRVTSAEARGGPSLHDRLWGDGHPAELERRRFRNGRSRNVNASDSESSGVSDLTSGCTDSSEEDDDSDETVYSTAAVIVSSSDLERSQRRPVRIDSRAGTQSDNSSDESEDYSLPLNMQNIHNHFSLERSSRRSDSLSQEITDLTQQIRYLVQDEVPASDEDDEEAVTAQHEAVASENAQHRFLTPFDHEEAQEEEDDDAELANEVEELEELVRQLSSSPRARYEPTDPMGRIFGEDGARAATNGGDEEHNRALPSSSRNNVTESLVSEENIGRMIAQAMDEAAQRALDRNGTHSTAAGAPAHPSVTVPSVPGGARPSTSANEAKPCDSRDDEESESDHVCAVCLEGVTLGRFENLHGDVSETVVLRCGHRLHLACFLPCVIRDPTSTGVQRGCPVCRREFSSPCEQLLADTRRKLVDSERDGTRMPLFPMMSSDDEEDHPLHEQQNYSTGRSLFNPRSLIGLSRPRIPWNGSSAERADNVRIVSRILGRSTSPPPPPPPEFDDSGHDVPIDREPGRRRLTEREQNELDELNRLAEFRLRRSQGLPRSQLRGDESRDR